MIVLYFVKYLKYKIDDCLFLYVKGEKNRIGLSGFIFYLFIIIFFFGDIFGGTFMFALVWMKTPLNYILALDITMGPVIICNFAFVENYWKKHLLWEIKSFIDKKPQLTKIFFRFYFFLQQWLLFVFMSHVIPFS